MDPRQFAEMSKVMAAKDAEIAKLRKTLQAVDDWLNDMDPTIEDENKIVHLVQQTLEGS